MRKDSPLVVGLGDGENLIASDIPALLEYTRDVIFLGDKEIAVLTSDSAVIYDEYGNEQERETYHVDWMPSRRKKGGFEHFMIKEIHEEPAVMTDTLKVKDGRINLESIGIDDENDIRHKQSRYNCLRYCLSCRNGRKVYYRRTCKDTGRSGDSV